MSEQNVTTPPETAKNAAKAQLSAERTSLRLTGPAFDRDGYRWDASVGDVVLSSIDNDNANAWVNLCTGIAVDLEIIAIAVHGAAFVGEGAEAIENVARRTRAMCELLQRIEAAGAKNTSDVGHEPREATPPAAKAPPQHVDDDDVESLRASLDGMMRICHLALMELGTRENLEMVTKWRAELFAHHAEAAGVVRRLEGAR